MTALRDLIDPADRERLADRMRELTVTTSPSVTPSAAAKCPTCGQRRAFDQVESSIRAASIPAAVFLPPPTVVLEDDAEADR